MCSASGNSCRTALPLQQKAGVGSHVVTCPIGANYSASAQDLVLDSGEIYVSGYSKEPEIKLCQLPEVECSMVSPASAHTCSEDPAASLQVGCYVMVKLTTDRA